MSAPVERAVVARVVDAVLARRSVAVVGPPGIGRSWTRRRVQAVLDEAGIPSLLVVATSSMAAVPFGALLPLLPDGAAVEGGLTGMALALRRALLAQRLLVVEDAQHLDEASAGLVHQTVVGGLPAVVVLRAGTAWPEAIERVVGDGFADVVVVEPLDETETGALLAVELDGPVDGRLVSELHRRTAGVPLAVRLHADGARRSGDVGRPDGVWRETRPLAPPRGLLPLVAGALEGLTEAGRAAVELVALADLLPLRDLLVLAEPGGVDEAVRAGALGIDGDDVVRPAQPVLADAALADLGVAARRRRLAALVTLPARGLSAEVRRAGWLLELGRAVPVPELLRLSRETATASPAAAARFSAAAVAAGGGVAAALLHADVLAHQHRAVEALAVLDGLDPGALAADERGTVVLTRAFLLVFALGRPREALRLLDGVALPPPAAPLGAAVASSARLWTGDTGGALAAADEVAADPAASDDARAHAALTAASALAAAGDAARLAGRLPSARRALDRVGAALPEGAETLRLIECLSLLRGPLDLDAVERRALDGAQRAIRSGDDGVRAQWDHLRGHALLLAGRVDEALLLLRPAAVAPGRWAVNGPFLRGSLVLALLLHGAADEAAVGLATLRTPSMPGLHEPYVLRVEAFAAACRHDLQAAVALAHRSAALGTGAMAADAWYDAVRFGSAAAAPRFLTAASTLSGPGRDAQRAHAEAVVRRSGTALERAVGLLAAAGLHWFALEAMTATVRMLGRSGAADAARFRLDRMAAGRPAIRSPLLRTGGTGLLTPRELQVAELAVEGRSARRIAERLGIGVRTVETHLEHVYRKLLIGSREELVHAMASRR